MDLDVEKSQTQSDALGAHKEARCGAPDAKGEKPTFGFVAFCQGMFGLYWFLPTHGLSLTPPKVKLVAGEQKATEFIHHVGRGRGGEAASIRPS